MIVGLAVGGLHAGISTLTRGQDGVTRDNSHSVAIRRLDDALQAFVGPFGPFRQTRPAAFSGTPQQFTFLCGAGRCDASLSGSDLVLSQGGVERKIPVPNARTPSFVYATDRHSDSSWPWPSQNFKIEKLRTVSIVDTVDGADYPITVAHLWVQQEQDCEFDTISRDCRRQLGS